MTKIQSTIFATETVSMLVLTLLTAFALIFAEASVPAGQRLSNYEAAEGLTVEAGSLSPNALYPTVDVSALPVQDGCSAF